MHLSRHRGPDRRRGIDLSELPSPYILAEATSIMGVTGAAFVSTNLDNLVVLSAYGAKPGYRSLPIKLTFVFVCLLVLVVSLALSRAAGVLPADKIRFLGLIPMGLGACQIVRLVLAADGLPSPEILPSAQGISAYLGFALVLLANSSDSVSVMTPLMADLKPVFVLAGFVAALLAAIAMSALAHVLALHPASKIHLETFAKWVLPFLLVGIGLLILIEKPSDIFVE
jgi:cadmium resistance protein CadD (predicted permease)